MKLWCLLLVVSVLVLPQESSASRHKHKASPAAVAAGDYVGSDTCIACHDDSSKTLEPTRHQKLFANPEPAKNGCEACHGPGSKHVDGNGDVEKIFRFTGAPISQVQLRCTGCHSNLGGDHGHAKLNCLSCHSVHHAFEAKFLLVKSTPDLCTGCHH